MEAVLYPTGSGSLPTTKLHRVPSSPRLSLSVPLHDDNKKKKLNNNNKSLCNSSLQSRIRRSSSESDIIRSESMTLTKQRSRSFHELPPAIPEEDDDDHFSDGRGISWEELGFPGGGMNNNRRTSGGGGGGGDDRCDIGSYYEKMIKSDPMNSLLLRNYGKYLHEVEGNYVKAEECYGRAILASPGDGEVLSLYGKLIWEWQRDGSRAKSYFKQALQVAPQDCTVLGSYAHFLWEVEDDDDDEEEEELGRSSSSVIGQVVMNAAMVQAY